MAPTLALRRLSKHYPEHVALHELSVEIGEGEFFSLLGPSGCGKTTTLRLIAGFEAPTGGEILLRGRPVAGLPPYERNVSTVFQNYALFPHMTVRENVDFGLRHRRGGRPGDADRRISELLEMLQLAGKAQRKPAQLSGGEKQRVALARALAVHPDVLLLDEPLSALDPNLRKQVRGELKELQRRVGITFVFITHDQEEALSLSDRMAVLNAGRVEQVGTPRDLYQQPRTRFTAGFLGPVNWIGPVGVRPEATRIQARGAEGERPGGTARRAVVERTVYLGNCLHVEARLECGSRVVAESRRLDEQYQPGQTVHVDWRAEDELRIGAAESDG
jgi:ABC-type Fe3+/spermidine/putrescine transport system ATPase subunit